MADYFELNKTFSCNYCHDILNEPVILPCGETTCKKHVEEMKNCEKLKCHFCNEEHSVPEKGFPKDIRMIKLIENKFFQMDLGETHSKAVNSCKELKELINNMKHLAKAPENFIDQYFDKIINEIDLIREENKLKIDQWHDRCLDQVKLYKNECLNNFEKLSKFENKNIEKFESCLELWEKKLKIPELSNKEYSFEKINSNADSSCLVLNRIFDGLKNNLLHRHISIEKTLVNYFPEIKMQKKVKCIH